jgi:putative thioredoxin
MGMEATTSSSQLVYDVTEADFEQRVLERSKTVPVVVDFWAEWCAPCRQLTPVLVNAVTARGGKVELAKLDTDANQQIAQAFQIQGIPAVKAFKDGRMVSEFTGALPPAAVDEFLDKLLPSEADTLADADDEDSLRKALTIDARNFTAATKLARLLLAQGEAREALATVAPIDSSDFEAAGLAARARLVLAEEAPTEAFEAWDGGDHERALELLLAEIRQTEDAERRDALRAIMVGWFTELGPENEAVGKYRRQLAAALN